MLVSCKAFKLVRPLRTRGNVACGATKRDVLLTSAAVTAFRTRGKAAKADETEQQNGSKEQQDAGQGFKSQEPPKAEAAAEQKAGDAVKQAQEAVTSSATKSKDADTTSQGKGDDKPEQTSSTPDAQKSAPDSSAKPEGKAAEKAAQPAPQPEAASKAAPAKSETKAEEKLQETAAASAEQKAGDKAAAPAAQKPAPAKAAEDKPAPSKGTEDKPAPAKAADDKPAPSKSAEDKSAPAKAADDKPAPSKGADDKSASAKAADDKPAPAPAPAQKETKAEQKVQDTKAADAEQKAKEKAATKASQKPAGKPWKDQDQRRMLHPVMIVADLEKQQNFYSNVLGMKALRPRSFRDGYDNGFSGFLPESTGTALEMTARSTPRKLALGSGFRHYTVAVSSIRDTVRKAKLLGYKAYEGENVDERHQFVRDPSGYAWELVFRPDSVKEPFREISLLVADIERSTKFYSKGLGMRVTMNKSTDKYSQVHLCWGDESSNTVLELTQPLSGPDANKPVERSKEGYLQLAVGTNDVYKTAEEVRSAGGKVLQEPGEIGGIGTQVTKVADPDGWILAFVDNNDFLGEVKKAGTMKK